MMPSLQTYTEEQYGDSTARSANPCWRCGGAIAKSTLNVPACETLRSNSSPNEASRTSRSRTSPNWLTSREDFFNHFSSKESAVIGDPEHIEQMLISLFERPRKSRRSKLCEPVLIEYTSRSTRNSTTS